MAYKTGNRHQINMFPPTYDELISQTDPVRVYDEFVEYLDFEELKLRIDTNKIGHPEYDPKAMLKLILYGCSYGIRSSRKLEQACHHNITFIWLTGGLKPDYRTIARFRKQNWKALKNVFKQCAKLCIKLGVIEGNILFVDGTKMRANAGIENTRNEETYKENLGKLNNQINKLLKEWERADKSEVDLGSLVKIREELQNTEERKQKIKNLISKMAEEDRASINSTDPECVKVKGRQGTHAGYNGQIVTDEKHGLIVACEAVNESNDSGQFARQINKANEMLEEICETAVADAGYANTRELEKIDQQGIEVIVPTTEQAKHKQKKDNSFSKKHFRYDQMTNTYTCPEGHVLRYEGNLKKKRQYQYRMKQTQDCHSCKYFGVCTKGKRGRTIKRLYSEDVKTKLEAHYLTESAQQKFKLRKHKVEKPFGHIKRNLGADHFLLRGKELVNAEFAVLATCFNIRRIITILGGSLIAKA